MRLMAFVRRSEVPFNARRRGKRTAAPVTNIALAALLGHVLRRSSPGDWQR